MTPLEAARYIRDLEIQILTDEDKAQWHQERIEEDMATVKMFRERAASYRAEVETVRKMMAPKKVLIIRRGGAKNRK